jgi:hypothetical protein
MGISWASGLQNVFRNTEVILIVSGKNGYGMVRGMPGFVINIRKGL